MGIARRYVEADDLVVTVWDGAVTAAEWAKAVKEQIADAHSGREVRRLTDARTVEGSRMTVGEIDTVSETYKGVEITASRVRLAIVAAQGWDMARVVEQRMEALGVSALVFSDVHAACAWLGVDPDRTTAAIAAIREELRTGVPSEHDTERSA